MAARLLAPAVRAAIPRVAASTRAMATKVEDVKLKDLPAYAQQVMKDPKTRTALEVTPSPLSSAELASLCASAGAGGACISLALL